MNARLVEDWLNRINERGYDVAFCQILVSLKGQRVLRAGHSPIEHGKDVISTSDDGAQVWGYQLKTGNFSQSDVTKHLQQLNMLVEARPIHPGLSQSFIYHPVLVTTGDFKEPAISLIRELNESWRTRGFNELTTINGRTLLADLVALSTDFWPVATPDIRTLRSLYLVEGKGDFDAKAFAGLMVRLIETPSAAKNVARQAAAANLFASYLISPFEENADHWNVFRGWTICASAIAWAGESSGREQDTWHGPFLFARQAAQNALELMIAEVKDENNLRSGPMELDDYTQIRNVTAMAAVACGFLITQCNAESEDRSKIIGRIKDFVDKKRFLYWGEGALSQFIILIWLLEQAEERKLAQSLLLEITRNVANRNFKGSDDALLDPYQSPDDCLMKLFSEIEDADPKHAIESYNLFPLIILCVRRHLRAEMELLWPQITRVQMTWLFVEKPADVLRWECNTGREHSEQFGGQRWKELEESAARQDSHRLPSILWTDSTFALMYLLAFQHRMLTSLYKRLDEILVGVQP